MFFISIIMGETALDAQGIIFDRKELSTYANIVSGKIINSNGIRDFEF